MAPKQKHPIKTNEKKIKVSDDHAIFKTITQADLNSFERLYKEMTADELRMENSYGGIVSNILYWIHDISGKIAKSKDNDVLRRKLEIYKTMFQTAIQTAPLNIAQGEKQLFPLLLTCYLGLFEEMRELLNAGADPNQLNIDGVGVIVDILLSPGRNDASKQVAILQELLAKDQPNRIPIHKELIDSKTKRLLLELACDVDNDKLLTLLLQEGLITSIPLENSFVYCLENKKIKCCKILCRELPEITQSESKQDDIVVVNHMEQSRDKFYSSLLFHCVRYQNPELIKQLLDKGAKISTVSAISKKMGSKNTMAITPLILAYTLSLKHEEASPEKKIYTNCIKELFVADFEFVSVQTGDTPIHRAIKTNNEDLVKRIINFNKYRIQENKKNGTQNKTYTFTERNVMSAIPLYYTVLNSERGRNIEMELLTGIDLDELFAAINNTVNPALEDIADLAYCLLVSDQIEKFKVLYEQYDLVDYIYHAQTFLQLAIIHNKTHFAKLILENLSDEKAAKLISYTDSLGHTALSMVVDNLNQTVFDMLIAKQSEYDEEEIRKQLYGMIVEADNVVNEMIIHVLESRPHLLELQEETTKNSLLHITIIKNPKLVIALFKSDIIMDYLLNHQSFLEQQRNTDNNSPWNLIKKNNKFQNMFNERKEERKISSRKNRKKEKKQDKKKENLLKHVIEENTKTSVESLVNIEENKTKDFFAKHGFFQQKTEDTIAEVVRSQIGAPDEHSPISSLLSTQATVIEKGLDGEDILSIPFESPAFAFLEEDPRIVQLKKFYEMYQSDNACEGLYLVGSNVSNALLSTPIESNDIDFVIITKEGSKIDDQIATHMNIRVKGVTKHSKQVMIYELLSNGETHNKQKSQKKIELSIISLDNFVSDFYGRDHTITGVFYNLNKKIVTTQSRLLDFANKKIRAIGAVPADRYRDNFCNKLRALRHYYKLKNQSFSLDPATKAAIMDAATGLFKESKVSEETKNATGDSYHLRQLASMASIDLSKLFQTCGINAGYKLLEEHNMITQLVIPVNNVNLLKQLLLDKFKTVKSTPIRKNYSQFDSIVTLVTPLIDSLLESLADQNHNIQTWGNKNQAALSQLINSMEEDLKKEKALTYQSTSLIACLMMAGLDFSEILQPKVQHEIHAMPSARPK